MVSNMESCSPTESSVEELLALLRSQDPTQYYTLIKMHLSFATDLSTDQCDGSLDSNNINNKWNLSPLLKKFIRGNSSSNAQTVDVPLSLNVVQQLFKLINYLNKDENLKQEGLFRKAGSVSRQMDLKSALQCGVPLDLNSGTYSAHDCASVLKSFLADLPEPLLLESQYHVHCRIAEMCGKGKTSSPEENSAIHARQVKALRLIFLLLPSVNYEILKEILLLLHRVTLFQGQNKMNALNLGTMLAPHILCPRKMSPSDLHFMSTSMSSAIAFIIENAPNLFQIPIELEIDVKEYFRRQKNMERQMSKTSLEEAPTKTSFSFVDRELTARASADDVTEIALAELYAYVQSLPDSTRKRKLIGQFNEASGHGTPKCSQSGSRKTEFKVKSFGDSLKKHLFSKKKSKTKNQMVKGLNIKRSNSEDIQKSSNYCSPELEQRRATDTKAKSFENLLSPKSSSFYTSEFLRDFGQSPQLPESMIAVSTPVNKNSFFRGSSEEIEIGGSRNMVQRVSPVPRFTTFGKSEPILNKDLLGSRLPENCDTPKETCVEHVEEQDPQSDNVLIDQEVERPVSDTPLASYKDGIGTPVSRVNDVGNNSPISRAMKRFNGNQNVMTPRSRTPLIFSSTSSLSSVTSHESSIPVVKEEEEVLQNSNTCQNDGEDFQKKECKNQGSQLSESFKCDVIESNSLIENQIESNSLSENQIESNSLLENQDDVHLLGGFYSNLSTSSLLKIMAKLHNSSDLTPTRDDMSVDHPHDDSLSNVFKEYLFNRSILMETSTDEIEVSISKDRIEEIEAHEKQNLDAISSPSLKSFPETIKDMKDIVNSPQLSDSLLLCLDGDNPSQSENSKRHSSFTEECHQSSPPKKNRLSDVSLSKVKSPTATSNICSFALGDNCNKLYSCSPKSRSLSLLKTRNGTPVPNKQKENMDAQDTGSKNVLFETNL